MQVQIEHLDNLRVINFYVPCLTVDRAVLFIPENRQSPEFVRNIFKNCAVERCLITPELFACKYAENAKIDDVRLIVMAELEDFLQDAQKIEKPQGEGDVLLLAQAVADSYIRPTLNRDKGDVELMGFQSSVLNLKFIGHCAGCPFAQNTFNNVVAKELKRLVPDIKEIRLEK